jgi:hypothetical protein
MVSHISRNFEGGGGGVWTGGGGVGGLGERVIGLLLSPSGYTGWGKRRLGFRIPELLLRPFYGGIISSSYRYLKMSRYAWVQYSIFLCEDLFESYLAQCTKVLSHILNGWYRCGILI